MFVRDIWGKDTDGRPADFQYSELNDERWNIRSVLQFRDGSYSYGDAEVERGGLAMGETVGFGLAEKPWPKELDYPPWVAPSVEISREEFDGVWQAAIKFWKDKS